MASQESLHGTLKYTLDNMHLIFSSIGVQTSSSTYYLSDSRLLLTQQVIHTMEKKTHQRANVSSFTISTFSFFQSTH